MCNPRENRLSETTSYDAEPNPFPSHVTPSSKQLVWALGWPMGTQQLWGQLESWNTPSIPRMPVGQVAPQGGVQPTDLKGLTPPELQCTSERLEN